MTGVGVIQRESDHSQDRSTVGAEGIDDVAATKEVEVGSSFFQICEETCPFPRLVAFLSANVSQYHIFPRVVFSLQPPGGKATHSSCAVFLACLIRVHFMTSF